MNGNVKRHLVTASLNSILGKTAPGEIVYIPVGASNINATISGKPGSIVVKVPVEKGEAIAAALQASLSARLASSVRPRLAFDHAKDGPAAGHPESFSFDPTRGIILKTAWSNSGRAAIEGGDYGYFSPTFLIDDDGSPVGLPDKGEIGSLVDEPAFREIGLIAAADAATETTLTPTKPEPTNTMSKLIFAALSIAESHVNAEAEAVNAINKLVTDNQTVSAKLVSLENENSDLKLKVEAAEKLAKDERISRADTLIKAAVADGRLAPKDDATIGKYRAKIEAGDTFAEEVLASLQPKNANLTKPIVNAADGVGSVPTGIEAKALALVTAGSAKSFDEALNMVAAAEPQLYDEYLGSLQTVQS